MAMLNNQRVYEYMNGWFPGNRWGIYMNIHGEDIPEICPKQLQKSSEAGFHGWMGELAGKHGSNHQTLHFADLLCGKNMDDGTVWTLYNPMLSYENWIVWTFVSFSDDTGVTLRCHPAWLGLTGRAENACFSPWARWKMWVVKANSGTVQCNPAK